MRYLINRILQILNVSGRDWAVFLLALLLAFCIWLIHNLSLRYTGFLQASVEAQCSIEGHSDISSNRCDVIARCKTTGFNLVKNGSVSRGNPVRVRFDQSVMRHKSGDLYYVVADDLKEYTHLVFGGDIQLEYFVSDTLFFRFPYENHKRVPVNPVHIIDFRSQYTAVGDLDIEPDSVTVYGEPSRLEMIDRINTEAIKLNDVSSSVHGMARLEKLKGVRVSEENIQYSLSVSRFVEMPVTVTIQTRNVPPGKTLMVYPSTADVILRCPFPLITDLTDGVRFYVDYNDFISSISGKCPLKAAALPQGIISYSIEPKIFECVVKEN